MSQPPPETPEPTADGAQPGVDFHRIRPAAPGYTPPQTAIDETTGEMLVIDPVTNTWQPMRRASAGAPVTSPPVGAGAASPSAPATSPEAARGGPKRWAPIVAAAALLLVGAGVLVLLLSGGDDRADRTAGKPTAAETYQQQVQKAMAPVIAANRKVSSALDGLRGARTDLAARRVRAAQQATVAARGALTALPAPAGSERLASNARGTLTREAAYLAAVRTALSDPSSGSAAQTQTLAGNLTGALDVVAPRGTDWSLSVTGADRLTAWAPRVVAARRRARQRAAAAATTPTVGSSSAPSAGGTACGDGVVAGPNTSCAFARNVHDAWLDAPGTTNVVDVFSPTTGRTYTMSCGPAGDGISCSGGNDASVSF